MTFAKFNFIYLLSTGVADCGDGLVGDESNPANFFILGLEKQDSPPPSSPEGSPSDSLNKIAGKGIQILISY